MSHGRHTGVVRGLGTKPSTESDQAQWTVAALSGRASHCISGFEVVLQRRDNVANSASESSLSLVRTTGTLWCCHVSSTFCSYVSGKRNDRLVMVIGSRRLLLAPRTRASRRLA